MGSMGIRYVLFTVLLGGLVVTPCVLNAKGPIFEIDDDESEEWSTSTSACDAHKKQVLTKDVTAACDRVRRALHIARTYDKELEVMYQKGTNMRVYLKNKVFYQKRLANRLKACDKGTVALRCVGTCGTSRETVAYVNTTLGYVHQTINVCNEFFSGLEDIRERDIAHEFGRLEGIGDADDMVTDNIFVWDAVLTQLSSPLTLLTIKEMAKTK